ncbi:MAG: hypothetical protein ACPGWR_15715 [Ardenticatenaceae bacterium]
MISDWIKALSRVQGTLATRERPFIQSLVVFTSQIYYQITEECDCPLQNIKKAILSDGDSNLAIEY